jgi:hypothetical protein
MPPVCAYKKRQDGRMDGPRGICPDNSRAISRLDRTRWFSRKGCAMLMRESCGGSDRLLLSRQDSYQAVKTWVVVSC